MTDEFIKVVAHGIFKKKKKSFLLVVRREWWGYYFVFHFKKWLYNPDVSFALFG